MGSPPVDENSDATLRRKAAEAVSGATAPLPFAAEIQRSFGPYDVASINATTGGRAVDLHRTIGASAHVLGESVAFSRTPNLRVAAHEAAHVIQQRAGVNLQGGVGRPGDAHERGADAVADAVVEGRSATSGWPFARTTRS